MLDSSLTVAASAIVENAQPVVRYNSSLLLQLTDQAKFFLFPRQCARHALGQVLDGTRAPEQARRASCWAISALRTSRTFDDSHAERTLEAELNLLDNAWPLLSCPAWTFNFPDCSSRGVLRLPGTTAPSPAQLRADRCSQICGDRLWKFQNRRRASDYRSTCQKRFDRCEGACATPQGELSYVRADCNAALTH